MSAIAKAALKKSPSQTAPRAPPASICASLAAPSMTAITAARLHSRLPIASPATPEAFRLKKRARHGHGRTEVLYERCASGVMLRP